jgi:NitT/TauT family transport system ATP-binding protein
MAAGEITVTGLGKSYGVGRFAREVVKDCSFTIERNRFNVMIGPSGVGKSTIIRMIAGFERPNAGRIALDGAPIDRPGRDRLVVFQENALFPWMTTAQNILYGPQARGENRREMRAAAEFLLDKVGLSAFRGRYPAQLSGGMQRRAELARAMINKPAVMILDEPFRGLDAMTKKLMLEYYTGLGGEREKTNFFVTTDIDEAIFLADRLLVMSHRPTRVRRVVEVDLPRPRRLPDIVTDDRANALKMQVLSLLHEEATKAFAGGSKAAADFVEAYRRRIAAE